MEKFKHNTISIVIATYNRSDSLQKTLGSIFDQNLNGAIRFEVIVVDNNSNDKTKSVVESFQKMYLKKIKYLFEPRQGKSYALNVGIQEAEGDIIAFTDDDCLVDVHWVENIKNLFQEKRIDLLVGRIVPVFDKHKPDWLDIEAFRGAFVNINLGSDYIENNRKITCAGANLIIRKSACAKYGNFAVNRRGQDVEFFNRWSEGGAAIGYSPKVIVKHRTPLSRMNKRYVRRWFFLAGQHIAAAEQNKSKEVKKIFKVPLWLYRRMLIRTGRYIKGILLFNKNNFVNEARLISSLGAIYAYLGFKKKFGDLR